ncbi:MAG TPA: universal stress protein [Bacteroidales bacterium]|jgi:nucleotide-binding universal stress UspA family protein|nr:universal stress protein [Bacteroidales bacterium]HOR60088.1 universal stress protein [Bacteroidales bacterium]HPL03757.1 universal stress protein [Bacteroidales bacterium]
MSKKRILVPTNFTSETEIAFEQSVLFSLKTDADIILFHVIPSLKMINSNSSNIDRVQEELSILAEKYFKETGKNAQTRIEVGKVLQQILMLEKEIKPSYIFLGSDVSKGEVSSLTLKLVNSVECPIIIFLRNFKKKGCEKIVLPLDLTKQTKQKVDHTIKLAKIYNSEVHIVSATNFTNETELAKLNDQLDYVNSIFEKLNIPTKTKILKTSNDIEIMANAINDYADDIDADLTVIMTRQETKIQKFFVGSMATKLINKSKIPILCISPNL